MPVTFINSGRFGSAASPRATDYLQSAANSSGGTPYTFSSQNLGAAASDRLIVVGMMGRAISTTTVTATVTVGGISAATVAEIAFTPTNTVYAGLAIVAVPTGTTGDVVVTYSRAMLRSAISLWRLTGYSSATPVDTGTASGNPLTNSLDVTIDGAGFACSANSGSATCTWTDLTEVADAAMGTSSYSSASAVALSTATLSVDATWTSGTENAAAFASWV